MFGSGRETLSEVREWSGGPPGCPGVVWRPSRMYASGREALTHVRECSGGNPGCPGFVEISWEALPEVWEWLGGPSGCPEVVGRQSRMFASGQEALPDVRE